MVNFNANYHSGAMDYTQAYRDVRSAYSDLSRARNGTSDVGQRSQLDSRMAALRTLEMQLQLNEFSSKQRSVYETLNANRAKQLQYGKAYNPSEFALASLKQQSSSATKKKDTNVDSVAKMMTQLKAMLKNLEPDSPEAEKIQARLAALKAITSDSGGPAIADYWQNQPNKGYLNTTSMISNYLAKANIKDAYSLAMAKPNEASSITVEDKKADKD